MVNEIRVNRIILSDLPDIYNFKSYEGNDCFGIFSTGEVISLTAKNASALGIDLDKTGSHDLPKLLSKALEDDNDEISKVANVVVAELGQRLAAVFYVLKRDPSITVESNDRYTAQDFESWQKIEHIFLVGGLANGALGRRLAENAQKTLCELGFGGVQVKAGKYPSDAQLAGVARLNDGKNKSALVLDMGHSFVKSAKANFKNGALVGLEHFDKIPSEFMGKWYEDKKAELEDAGLLHGFIVDTIANLYKKCGDDVSDHISISIANNVRDGVIAWGGCYYKLKFLSDNYEELLENDLSGALGRRITVSLAHDGRAAALCFDEVENAAVFALGTAFGVGYTEGRRDLLPVEM